MDFKFISQYAGFDAHYKFINEILESEKYTSFRTLSAFVTLGGLVMVEKSLEKFLEKGNEVFWIIGIDQGITTKEALEFLKALQLRYPKKAQFKVFTSGSNQYIFHPKVFFFEGISEFTIITGSANSTEGGLLGNFELSTKLELPKNSELGKIAYEEFDRIWKQYSTPELPLLQENLIDLCSTEGEKLLSSFDEKDRETSEKRLSVRLEHPMKEISKRSDIASKIKERHGHRTGVRKTQSEIKATQTVSSKMTETESIYEYLIMDILTETRKTQVQFPKKVITPFFNDMDKIELHYRENGKVAFEADRPLVSLDNDTVRIELSEIDTKARPLIMKMSVVPGNENVFIYELFNKGTKKHVEFDNLLKSKGNQTRKGARRWIII
jgi:HKD family nuclease